MNDVNDVGQGKTHNEVVQKYDSEHGKYADAVEKVPQPDLLQENQMPKGPDPSPFTLGPLTPGGR